MNTFHYWFSFILSLLLWPFLIVGCLARLIWLGAHAGWAMGTDIASYAFRRGVNTSLLDALRRERGW